MPPSRWRRREYGHRGLLYACRLLAQTGGRQPDRLLSGPGGYPAHAASGREPPRSGPSRRAGWPKPRWPASLARGCLHPEHSGKRRPILWWRGSELLSSESSRFALVQHVPAWPVVAVRSAASSLECGPTSGVTAGNGCETAHVKTPDRGQLSGPIGRLQLAETLNRKAGEISRTRGVKEGGN